MKYYTAQLPAFDYNDPLPDPNAMGTKGDAFVLWFVCAVMLIVSGVTGFGLKNRK